MNIQSKFLRAIKQAVVIVFVAVVVGLIFNSLSSTGIPLIAEAKKLPPDSLVLVESTGQASEPWIINILEVAQLFEEKAATFIDARKPEFFEYGHIPGAKNLNWTGDEIPDSLLTKISQNLPIVTYCSDPECENAIELAYYLFEKGFTDIRIFHEGFEVWSASNFPIEKKEVQ